MIFSTTWTTPCAERSGPFSARAPSTPGELCATCPTTRPGHPSPSPATPCARARALKRIQRTRPSRERSGQMMDVVVIRTGSAGRAGSAHCMILLHRTFDVTVSDAGAIRGISACIRTSSANRTESPRCLFDYVGSKPGVWMPTREQLASWYLAAAAGHRPVR